MSRASFVTALVAAGALLAGAATATATAAGATTKVPASLCNAGKPPTISPTVPADAITNQGALNCFAWQEFIALNWQADTATCAADTSQQASSFGDPGNAPSVWETYKSPDAVFLPDAVKPPGWCEPQLGTGTTTTAGRQPASKRLSGLNKFALAGEVDLSEITQTDPARSWLTAQSGLLTLYEVRLNEDEFNYIYTNELYDATKQTELAMSEGINLPDGSPASSKYGEVGTIELKAAWLELDDPKDWPRFKTSLARVKYPNEPAKTVTVGLVGLHIIHKTQSAQQFVWATFEHVDNVPSSDEDPKPGRRPPYTYFNPSCDPATDHYKCKVNAVPRACKSAAQDAPAGCDPYDAPMQIVRTTPLNRSPTNSIVQLNDAVRAMITSANDKSVFRHYELVNVLWPDNSTQIGAGARTPLTCGDATPPPSQEIVANTTIETFLQGGKTGEPDPQPDPCNAGASDYTGDTCLTCHTFGQVANPKSVSPDVKVGNAKGDEAPLASDYSFLLSHADAPPVEDGGVSSAAWIGGGIGAVLLIGGGVVLARRRRQASG